ncbi:hypothetical protein M3Y99_01332800 [Aphelenchoides fujianensis]|nr:hypothetical protein M3Y99_01332800 [Aphelenchoides fujianensis]
MNFLRLLLAVVLAVCLAAPAAGRSARADRSIEWGGGSHEGFRGGYGMGGAVGYPAGGVMPVAPVVVGRRRR